MRIGVVFSLIPTLLPRGEGCPSLSLRERAGVREHFEIWDCA